MADNEGTLSAELRAAIQRLLALSLEHSLNDPKMIEAVEELKKLLETPSSLVVQAAAKIVDIVIQKKELGYLSGDQAEALWDDLRWLFSVLAEELDKVSEVGAIIDGDKLADIVALIEQKIQEDELPRGKEGFPSDVIEASSDTTKRIVDDVAKEIQYFLRTLRSNLPDKERLCLDCGLEKAVEEGVNRALGL